MNRAGCAPRGADRRSCGGKRRAGLSAVVIFSLAIAAAALFPGCGTTMNITEPAGFAVAQQSEYYFRAISPEGVLFSVRTEANYPEMDTKFWQDAVKTQLVSEGYVILKGPEPISASGSEGFYIEWGVPYRNDTYVYLTAVIPVEKLLYIFEAGGPRLLYDEYREGIHESIKSLALDTKGGSK